MIETRSLSHTYCSLTQHAEGKWVFREDVGKKTFVCCGWDSHDYKDSEIKDICYPHDVYRSEFSGNDDTSNPNIMHAGGHACICDQMGHTRLTKSRREQWTWEPTNCKLRDWSAAKFCSILGNKKVIFLSHNRFEMSFEIYMIE